MSIGVIAAATLIAATSPAERSLRRPAHANPYLGRWTVSEPPAHYTARGRIYKTIDIVPCGPPRAGGRDFCGVSVADGGACGVTLFRFLGSHARSEDTIHGHGVWGTQRKNLTLDTWGGDNGDGTPSARSVQLYVGDSYDFETRGASMPKFHAIYGPAGAAQCMAR